MHSCAGGCLLAFLRVPALKLRGLFVELMGWGGAGEGYRGQNKVSPTSLGRFGVLCVVGDWRPEALRLRVQASCFRSPDGRSGGGMAAAAQSRAAVGAGPAGAFWAGGHRKSSLRSLVRRWCDETRAEVKELEERKPRIHVRWYMWSGDTFWTHFAWEPVSTLTQSGAKGL